MAKILSKAGITTGNTVEDFHVTQSIDAFTGIDAYDISLSGSFNLTGSLFVEGLSDTTQLNILTYNPSTFQVFNTSSIGFLYPLSSSLAADINNLSSSVSTDINNLSSSFTTTINNLSSSISSGSNFANTDLTFDANRSHNTDGNDFFLSADGNFTTTTTTDGFLQIGALSELTLGFSQSAQTQYVASGITHTGNTIISGSLTATGLTAGAGTNTVAMYDTGSGQFYYTSSAAIGGGGGGTSTSKPPLYIRVGSAGPTSQNGYSLGKTSSGTSNPGLINSDSLSLEVTKSLALGDQIVWKTKTDEETITGFKLIFNGTYLIGDFSNFAPIILPDMTSSFTPSPSGPDKVLFEIDMIKFDDIGNKRMRVDVKQTNFYDPSRWTGGINDPVTTEENNLRYSTPNPEANPDWAGINYPTQTMTFDTFIGDLGTANSIDVTLEFDKSGGGSFRLDSTYCRLIQA